MLKSILVSLAVVGSITAKKTTTEMYAYDAPDGCNTSLSYASCVQPATAIDDCSMSDTPCSCSAEDLNRKCHLSYCSGVSYTHSLWMNDCTSLGYSYIDTNGDYVTEPASASATATGSVATETGDSSSATDAASTAASTAALAAASSAGSKASAGAGSPTSGSSPTSPANASASSKPNDAGHAMGFPAGGMLAILATAAGTMVGMLLL